MNSLSLQRHQDEFVASRSLSALLVAFGVLSLLTSAPPVAGCELEANDQCIHQATMSHNRYVNSITTDPTGTRVGNAAFFTLIGIPLTCWACALVATPHKPRPGKEVEELVYARLLGGQQRLILLALIITLLAFVAVVLMLPARMLAEGGPPIDLHACNVPATPGERCEN